MSRARDRREDSLRADESATSSNPSSPEPTLDDDADSFALQSNESQSSFGATASRPSSPSPSEGSTRPKVPVENLPPELLISIFQKLSSTQDLYNCVRVCKKWAKCSIELLWHRPLFTDEKKLLKVAQAIQDPKSCWEYTDLIKRLNLSNLASKINDGTMDGFSACKRIERLTLTGCSSLTDQGITRLVDGNKSLLALDITGIHSVSDHTIQALARNCLKLQGLNVTGCVNVTDNSLVPLANACKHLKRLKLNKCSLVTDSSIESFATRCPSMLEIDLQGCDLITDSSVTALLQTDKYLRELRLASCQKVTDHAFLSLPSALKLESLRILDLTACFQLTDAAVERMIESAPRLRILVLAKCVEITDRAVYAISKLGKNLHDIHLGRCVNVSDAALKELVTKCNRIRYIDLAGCTRVTDDSIKMLANLPKLRRIGLVKCHNITDASIRALARGNAGQGPPTARSQLSSSLERVHLSYCINITLEGVNDLLRKCPKLTHLSLTGIQAFFNRDDLLSFCREAPPEFNEEQRQVFCVFSGEGVHRLRDHLANDPSAYGADDVSMYDDGPDSADDINDPDMLTDQTVPYSYRLHPYLPAMPQPPEGRQAIPNQPPGTVHPAQLVGREGHVHPAGVGGQPHPALGNIGQQSSTAYQHFLHGQGAASAHLPHMHSLIQNQPQGMTITQQLQQLQQHLVPPGLPQQGLQQQLRQGVQSRQAHQMHQLQQQIQQTRQEVRDIEQQMQQRQSSQGAAEPVGGFPGQSTQPQYPLSGQMQLPQGQFQTHSYPHRTGPPPPGMSPIGFGSNTAARSSGFASTPGNVNGANSSSEQMQNSGVDLDDEIDD